MPNWHFGAYFINCVAFYEEINLKWHTFRKGTFQGRSIAWQIYNLDSWNLVQNCYTASSFRTISHCLTILSYIVSRNLNVRKGYPYPQILNFWRYAVVWILCRMHEKQQQICIFMISSATFVIPNWHFGAYLTKLGRLYEEINLKWHNVSQGGVSGFIHSQTNISWNLIQNCPIASSYRNIYHCLTIISYIIFRILNVREGYPHPQIPNFDHCTEDGIWWPISLQLLHDSNWSQIECKA